MKILSLQATLWQVLVLLEIQQETFFVKRLVKTPLVLKLNIKYASLYIRTYLYC